MNLKKLPVVLYDDQIFSVQKAGGVSRYYKELITNIGKFGCEPKLPTVISDNLYLELKKPSKFLSRIDKRISTRIIQYANKMASLKSIKGNKYDILHPTYYSTYHLNKNKKPLVVTVYDMIHELFPDYFEDSELIFKNKKALLNRANQIIAISDSTKNDILKFIDIDPKKISVTHLATSIFEVAPENPKIPIKNYILFVGERRNYKNFNQLLDAFKNISEKIIDATLFCAGGGPFREEELNIIEILGLKNKVYQKNVTENELSWSYKNAICFVFPSLYEGFGIPVLESMSLDTITILSNKSCFPEIALTGASYFNNSDELADLIIAAYLKPSSFEITKNEAKKITNQYSWELTAKKTADIYHTLF